MAPPRTPFGKVGIFQIHWHKVPRPAPSRPQLQMKLTLKCPWPAVAG